MAESNARVVVAYSRGDGLGHYAVHVTTVHEDPGPFGRRTQHFVVASPADVKDWDGYLVIEGAAHTRIVQRPGESTKHFGVDARVTIFPPGEATRVDVTYVEPVR